MTSWRRLHEFGELSRILPSLEAQVFTYSLYLVWLCFHRI
jgi:hypothetical protein